MDIPSIKALRRKYIIYYLYSYLDFASICLDRDNRNVIASRYRYNIVSHLMIATVISYQFPLPYIQICIELFCSPTSMSRV